MAGRRIRARSRRRRRLRAMVEEEVDPADSGPDPPLAGPDPLPPGPESSPNFSTASLSSSRKIPKQQKLHPRDPRAVRPLLLSIIRDHYLDAISRLPAAELSSTLARGFLVAGHCYGPLHPVHNIILNSLWYAAAFPFRTDDPIDVAVITTQAIDRLVHRSLDGLLAYLRHLCPDLSHDDALWHLCLSGADLHAAAASARGAVPLARAKKLETVPFQTAAEAARHPKPAAITLFVTSVLPHVEHDAVRLLTAKRRLSSADIDRLSAMLLPSPLPEEPLPQPSPRKQSPSIIRTINVVRGFHKRSYQTLLHIADAALRKFAHETGAHHHLHTIYGHNIVSPRDRLTDQYHHINFMAWPTRKLSLSPPTHNETPVRFFAEAHLPPPTNCPEEDITFCCMLVHPLPSHVESCYLCARNNRKVDHPISEDHFGRHAYKTAETEKDHGCPSTVDVDYRFFDPDRDIELVQSYYADGSTARVKPKCSKLHSDNACADKPASEDDGDDEDNMDDGEITDEDIFSSCCR